MAAAPGAFPDLKVGQNGSNNVCFHPAAVAIYILKLVA